LLLHSILIERITLPGVLKTFITSQVNLNPKRKLFLPGNYYESKLLNELASDPFQGIHHTQTNTSIHMPSTEKHSAP